MSEQASGPSTETVALVMFFAGFALGVQAERTQVPAPSAAPVVSVAQIAPASATPLAMRGMTGLMQLGAAIAP